MTTVVVDTSVVIETTPATTAMETTDRAVSSSHHVTHEDEGEVSMTEREPAYSMTSAQTDDVTTVMMAQPLPDDDTKQQGA